jgi:hypothetical protein
VIAVKHYEWLKRGLEAAGLPASPYNIALAWNGGLSAVISGRSPAIAHDYARRAVNLAAVYDTGRPEVNRSLLLADASTSASLGASQ